MMGSLEFSNIIVPVFVTNLVILIIFLSPSATSGSTIEVADELKEMRLEMNQLNRKTGLLELKNDDQDKEIRSLKNIILDLIVKPNGDEEMKSGGVMMRNKRPASLIHLQHSMMSNGDEAKPFVGPPKNCNDLNKIGHTLNGIYLVNENSNSKISAVFCDFHPLIEGKRLSSSSIIEKNFGSIDVKNNTIKPDRNLTGIYFYVNIGGGSLMVPDNSVLKYDHQVLNVGRAMNLMTGVFTAPKAGIYTFAFSMIKNGFSPEYLEIFLRVNGKKVGHSWAGKGLFSTPIALQSTLKLKKGDRVDLLKSNGGLHATCSSFCHHFTGWLLEEDPKN